MPANKFRFVSPGIFLNEIDQSQIPTLPENVGPVIIGRAEKGPGMVPTTVNSFSEFVETFGNPIAGRGGVEDTWRDGNYSSPTYGAYAAQAYLAAGVGPVTFIRLMGSQSPQASATGKAGWETLNSPDTVAADNGGPYGLFVFDSGSATNNGTLAAVWYMDSGSVPVLSGSFTNGQTEAEGLFKNREGVATIVDSSAAGEFKIRIVEGNTTVASTNNGTELENRTVVLDRGSDRYIRKQFNTNPQKVNSTIEDATDLEKYWLGETYERHLEVEGFSTAASRRGVILALVSGSTERGNHDKRMAYRDAHSGWFFSQNIGASASYEYNDMTKLFKFIGINGYGSQLQRDIKISIDNIKYSRNDNVDHGIFDVVIRSARDGDLAPVVIERYSECSLDKNSSNYLPLVIGDRYQEYDAVEKRYREYGQYPNRSKYVRVHMNSAIEGGVNSTFLPFGVYGPPRFPSFTFTSGSTDVTNSYVRGSGSVPADKFGTLGLKITAPIQKFVLTATGSLGNFGTANITFPKVGIRPQAGGTGSNQDGADPTTNAFFGLQNSKNPGSTTYDPGYPDYIRAFGADVVADSDWVDDFGKTSLPNGLVDQWVFSLDELILTKGSSYVDSNPTQFIEKVVWTSGSVKAGTSWNAAGSGGATLTANRYKNILDAKVNRFTSPMFGGFDGVDITERDPFRNSLISSNPNEEDSYVYYSLRKAVDIVADPEVTQMNLLSMPGITDERVTKHIIDTAESRADTLGIIDVEGGLTPRHESSAAASTRRGNVNTAVTEIAARNINNSYGAAYYPWVNIRDDINGTLLYVPPSVVALGVLANTERASDVWFAPAGFNRGGLSTGAGGLPVVGVEQKLTSRNRDDLYDVNINPIASFPAEGIVVFGQKTLQAVPSALDRINIRRLMIFVKRGISRISTGTLFQPNVEATWNDFKSRAERFLNSVKVNFGIDDFKIVLDETTTTPDLVDRNILYAKIFIKPTRAIEFIAIDFIITRSGASFED
jgi:hypothetical protein